MNEREILQRWLSARYRRSAFPDEFDKRLADTGILDRLRKILRSSGDLIAAIYFDLDKGQELSRSGTDDIYELRIILLYSTEIDPDPAEAAATAAAAAIEKVFRERCFTATAGQWHHIELIECLAISDAAMTIREAERLRKWHAEYISLGADPPKTMLNNE